ncbi:hypothetical protein DID88_008367 [Monilinia fructigena]|uniref:Uncharacterized protein n=1 Tax=Monilinia fructigena TaxID=38457 RepID=A0A395J669_9HELO|nr:hypothetical protein DID88_008367 [Monilinia fructigena]
MDVMDNPTFDVDKHGVRKTGDAWLYPRMIDYIATECGGFGIQVGCFWRAVEYHLGGIDHFIHRDRRLFLEYMMRLELEAWSIGVRKLGIQING